MVSATSNAVSRALDPTTQLYEAPSGPFGIPLFSEKGQALGPASTVSMALGLERMADMADYLGYEYIATMYRKQAAMSRAAIDRLFWNATNEYYAGTIGEAGYDSMDIAQVLLGQIGTEAHRKKFLDKLLPLKVPAGYIKWYPLRGHS